MQHNHPHNNKHRHRRHRTIARLEKKFKHLAAAVAGAAILSGAMMPGMPAATVHASADPNAGNTPVTATEQVKNINQGGSSVEKNITKQIANQQNKSVQEKETVSKTTQADKSAGQKSATHKQNTSDSKAPSDYKKVLDIKATAYAPGAHDNDQWGDKTFTGTQVRPGIIAVDPHVIPLGSRVYIQYPDGHGEYATAEDTGGAIKGNRIDIAKSSVDKAQDFGMQNVKVYIVSGPKEA